MDNEEYRNDAYKKIKIYEDEGYLHGVDFIYFFESESHPLNLKNIFVYLNLYIINPAKDLINWKESHFKVKYIGKYVR